MYSSKSLFPFLLQYYVLCMYPYVISHFEDQQTPLSFVAVLLCLFISHDHLRTLEVSVAELVIRLFLRLSYTSQKLCYLL